MLVKDITQEQLKSFSAVERVGSAISLLGCIFIIGSYSLSKAFHRPINRLVFYASFGNLMTNVATLMARSPLGDLDSGACQFQAFLIQMFMPADAFWTLSMAVNVYLTFYHKFDAQRLRRMEIIYLICCYGIPFIVALTFVFVSTPDKGRMYGDATLWCWVSSKWDIFRIATFYGPVWLIILCTMLIYIRAGRDIWKRYRQLRNFSSNNPQELDTVFAVVSPFGNIKTTEVSVTTEKGSVGTAGQAESATAARRKSQVITVSDPKPPSAAYSVTISTQRRQSFDDQTPTSPTDTSDQITMVVVDDEAVPEQTKSTPNFRRKATYESSKASWSYTKCAVLFFTAMLVTWIPSSANRVFSVLNPGEVSLALEYFSSCVLPLQGFWNAVIYAVISWEACKMLVSDRLNFSQRPSFQEVMFGSDRKPVPRERPGRMSASFGRKQDPDSDSVAELAHSRPVSMGQRSSNASKEEV